MFRFTISNIIVFLCLYIQSNAEVNSTAAVTNSRDSATFINNLVKSNYESNFNSKIALPVTSGSQITSLDGKKSGTVNITCNTDKILLAKISILKSRLQIPPS